MALPPPLPLNTSRALSCVVIAIIFPVLATFCVVGRFISRRIQRGGYGADDWIIVLALLAVYGQMTIIIMSTVYGGVGFHRNDLSKENLVVFYKLIAAVQFTFGSSLGLVKISLCALLIRIFYSKTFRIAGFCVMGYCIAWMIMTLSIGAGLCRPFAYNWDKTIPGGKCGDLDSAYIAIAALDIAGDAAIIILPMPMVWKLNISTGNKIGLSFLFALGFLDIIVAILRIYYLTHLDFNADYTWDSTGTYIWSVIEPSLAVGVACGVLFKPLFKSWFPSFFKPTTHESDFSLPSRVKSALVAQKNYSNISEHDVPLYSIDQHNRGGVPTLGTSSYGRTTTLAEGSERNFLNPAVVGPDPLEHSEDRIWVQRDIAVKFTPKEDI